MPRIFDNIKSPLAPVLQETLSVSNRADFCVGYFNLRGWNQLGAEIEKWPGGSDHCCRLLVGMQSRPSEELHTALSLSPHGNQLDNQTALRLKRTLAEEFREQLCLGAPTNSDEVSLRRLARQLRSGKVVVKLFLKHPLHAKLYLLFRSDPVNPTIGYLGSSNLTFAGLQKQGELNIDVLDRDAATKLAGWFEDRWSDRWCVDISKELMEIIETSWAREISVPPYYIYLKMAYHLSQEARTGLTEFKIPRDFGDRLFDFQKAAVKIAAHHLNKRRGVLIGDVVGLGKTLMATALARIFEDDYGLETLIICPKNLVGMWSDYKDQYRMRARVLSITKVISELPENIKRFRLVIIDESHNLRNRKGKRYRVIQDYLERNESRVILLSATPYNKTYLDLSSQLRLFVPDNIDLGIRPECFIREHGELELSRRQCAPRTLAAFEQSQHADDWRELMRLYLVRRTRSFIQENYAEKDVKTGRKYLTFSDGTRSYFPTRIPRTVKFAISDGKKKDQYSTLFRDQVLSAINSLCLPRYGLGNYISPSPQQPPSRDESSHLDDLSRAGRRLMGFCRTNLFKRLESSGHVFIQSLDRHVLRNFVYLYAIDNCLPLPIGTQDIGMLDGNSNDEDLDSIDTITDLLEEESDDTSFTFNDSTIDSIEYKTRAEELYQIYSTHAKRRFKWLSSSLFIKELRDDLIGDSEKLMEILHECGDWIPEDDMKLDSLEQLLARHKKEKVLVFSQFADTVHYLTEQLKSRGFRSIEGVTGDSPNPTQLAWCFSPVSNNKREQVTQKEEIRILIATDVLSEGQNLQDCSTVVNYDLPWAIIRLIQRVGRVDRIGQQADEITCYSFLPADGVERIIRLRERVLQRLEENAEVVGTDEFFFEGGTGKQAVLDLYNEKAGIFDGDSDNEVDLASYAYQIWKNAIEASPALEKEIPMLPNVSFSTRPWEPSMQKPEGVLVYMRTRNGNDALAWIDKAGQSVTESQFEILKAAECRPDTLALARLKNHHELVRKGAAIIVQEERTVGGQLGRPSGARFRTYARLQEYLRNVEGEIFDIPELHQAFEQIYKFPLRQTAKDSLNRQLKSGISDETLSELVLALYEEDRLCLVHDEGDFREPRVICSLGMLREPNAEVTK